MSLGIGLGHLTDGHGAGFLKICRFKMARTKQLAFKLPTWGGKRTGAGRKPKLDRPGRPRWPYLVALGVVAALWLAVKAWKHRWLQGNFIADFRRRLRETAR